MEKRERASHPEETLDQKLIRYGYPSDYIRWGWGGVVVPEGARLGPVRAWEGDPPLMSIVGPTGSGKTGLALCVMRDWVMNGHRALWLHVPTWLDKLRAAEGQGRAGEILELVHTLDGLVVLDELISNRVTPYGADVVYNVLDSRLREGLPTIATANKPPELLERLDARVASRVRGGLVVPWIGDDRRTGRPGAATHTNNIADGTEAATGEAAEAYDWSKLNE